MSLIDELFMGPMGHHYTLPAILLYGLLFIAAIYLVYTFVLKKFKVKVNLVFILSLVPFIIYGGMTRALRDAGAYTGYLFVSPGIYITLFFITLASLIFSILIQRRFKISYWKPMVIIGSILILIDVILVASIGIKNLSAFYIFPGLFALWGTVFLLLHKFYPQYLSNINALALFSQMMDASQSFSAVYFFGYSQQLPVVSGLTSIFGSWIIFPVKLAVVFGALYAIDRYSMNTELNNWMKLGIIILGMPMGFRGILRIGMGV